MTKDSHVQGKHVVWMYRKRRYRCPYCGKRFYETNDLSPKWHRISSLLVALGIGLLSSWRASKEIAASLGASPSSGGRWRQYMDHSRPQLLPSVDGFKGDTEHGKFQEVNNSIKVLKQTAYDFRNFQNFRTGILASVRV